MLVYPASVTSLLADADSGPPTEWKVCPSVVRVQLREVASSWQGPLPLPSVRLPPLWLELLRIFAVAAVHDPHLVVDLSPSLDEHGRFPFRPTPDREDGVSDGYTGIHGNAGTRHCQYFTLDQRYPHN